MEESADSGLPREQLAELRRDERRVRREKTNAPKPVSSREPFEETGEGQAGFRAAVGVDGLAEERDLAVSPRREVECFELDLARPPAALPASRERDDAERAELIAPFDDRDVGLGTRSPRDRLELIRGGIGRELQKGRAVPLPRRLDGFREPFDVARAEHEIDEREPVEDAFADALRDAPGDSDDAAGTFAFPVPESAELRVNLPFRLLPHVARVQEKDVAVPRVLHSLVAPGFEKPGHPLAVEDVHLAAPRLDVKFPARGSHSRIQPG